MITVFGASGDLGRRIVRRLRESGHPVRAVSRQRAHLADAVRAGATVCEADLRVPATLTSALVGTDVLVSTANAILGRGDNDVRRVDLEGNAALVEAARRAGVRRFVFVSAWGASPDHPADFFRAKAAAESALRRSGLRFALVRPSAFMEVWARMLGEPVLAGKTVTVFGPGRNPVPYVASEDVARVCAALAIDVLGSDETLELPGPERLSPIEVVETFGRLSGLPARRRHVPRSVLRLVAAVSRPMNPVLSRLVHAALWSEATQQTTDPATVQARFGPLTRLEDFARARIAERRGRRAA